MVSQQLDALIHWLLVVVAVICVRSSLDATGTATADAMHVGVVVRIRAGRRLLGLQPINTEGGGICLLLSEAAAVAYVGRHPAAAGAAKPGPSQGSHLRDANMPMRCRKTQARRVCPYFFVCPSTQSVPTNGPGTGTPSTSRDLHVHVPR